jgi:hypothetical protein
MELIRGYKTMTDLPSRDDLEKTFGRKAAAVIMAAAVLLGLGVEIKNLLAVTPSVAVTSTNQSGQTAQTITNNAPVTVYTQASPQGDPGPPLAQKACKSTGIRIVGGSLEATGNSFSGLDCAIDSRNARVGAYGNSINGRPQ